MDIGGGSFPRPLETVGRSVNKEKGLNAKRSISLCLGYLLAWLRGSDCRQWTVHREAPQVLVSM